MLTPKEMTALAAKALDDKMAKDIRILEVRDITAETIPHDFARTPKIHHCFEIKAL